MGNQCGITWKPVRALALYSPSLRSGLGFRYTQDMNCAIGSGLLAIGCSFRFFGQADNQLFRLNRRDSLRR
jgi:hypothetical protein